MPSLSSLHLKKCEDYFVKYRLEHCNDLYPDEDIAMVDAMVKTHWYFLDELVYSDSNQYNLTWFSNQLFQNITYSCWNKPTIRKMMKKFRTYQNNLPRCGGIVLDKTLKYMLIVQSYYRKAWSFPQGKLEEGKALYHCAQSEVYEETGINVRDLQQYKEFRDLPLEIPTENRHTTLYFFAGVDRTTRLEPVTRCEVSSFRWIPVEYMWKKSTSYDFLEPLKPYFTKLFPEVRRRYKRKHTV